MPKKIFMQLLSPQEIHSNSVDYFIVDVREKYEYDYANTGALNIPMAELCNRLDELPTDKKVVLMCRSGKRAAALCNLITVDYCKANIFVMDGGIEAWRDQVEPTLILE